MGKDQSDYKEVTYEGYGPHGVAIFVETLTDNPAFNIEYEKDQIKVYWLRKDLSTLPTTLPVTCPTVTTASQISY